MPISISNLFKEFQGPKKALIDITHSFPSEDITVVIGTNGSGKSTLLNCVVGLLPFEQGQIEVELAQVQYELRKDNPILIPADMRKHIGYIFQQKALWQHLTVIKNLVHPLIKVHKLSPKEALLRAQEYLDLIELKKDYYNKFPNELSGGEQRKVAIARTLSIEPELLLIDELEANLDQTARKLTLEIIQDKFIRRGKTVLIVSHSIDLLEQFTPHILVLHEGQVVESAKGISELLLKNHLSPHTTKIIKESVDSSSSRWFLANQSLEAAIKISEINVTEKDLNKILTEIGKEISKLITRFDPEAEHLLMIATKAEEGSDPSDVRIRCAEKTDRFILDGSEVRKLSKIITGGVFNDSTGRVTYQFTPEYRDDFQTDQGIKLERKTDLAGSRHDSLIDMMFDTNGQGLYYQVTPRHPQIFGAKNISVPIPDDHLIEKLSYYEFSGRTRNVYLIGCSVGDKVKGIISIDTYSDKKWSNFIVQQLILVGNMVAIAIKNHELDAENDDKDANAPVRARGPIDRSVSEIMFAKGFFSELDSIHVHVDGGVAANLVQNVVELLNSRGYPSKWTSIQDAIAGPQRKDLSTTYKSHTPGSDDQEKLEYFSTTLFKSLDEAKHQLKWLLGELRAEYGIVIEAEQVIGKIGQEVRWSKMSPREVPIIQSAEVGFDRSNTLPVEIHYGCDIPKERDWTATAPLRLETLLEVCAELEIRVGGWFLFEENNTWCYRANMFERDMLPQRVKKQRDDLAEQLNRIGDDLGFDCKVTALVERSLGVWKTPLTPWTPTAQRKP